MLKKYILIFAAAFSFNANASNSANEIKIAAGVMSGAYYPVAVQLCSIITKYSPVTKCEVLATSGSINNLNMLSSERVDFAFVQSDIARDASKGMGVFSNQKYPVDLRLVLNLFPEVLTMVVKDESGIVNFSDISGRKIGVNLRGSGAKSGLMTLFKYFKFDKDPEIVSVNESQMSSKLCDNEVDSVVLFTGHPSGVVSEVTSTCDVEFINIDPLKLDALLVDNPIYEKSILASKSYVGISRNATSMATKALLVTSKNVSSEKVKLLTRIVNRYFDEFKTMYPVLNGMKKEEIFKDSFIPLYE